MGSFLRASLLSAVLASLTACAEPETKTYEVKAYLVPCHGVGLRGCMLTRAEGEPGFSYFYDEIEGFSHEWGFEYALEVQQEPSLTTQADDSSLNYKLITVLSKGPVPAGTRFTIAVGAVTHGEPSESGIMNGDCAKGYTLFPLQHPKSVAFESGLSCAEFEAALIHGGAGNIEFEFRQVGGPLSLVAVK